MKLCTLLTEAMSKFVKTSELRHADPSASSCMFTVGPWTVIGPALVATTSYVAGDSSRPLTPVFRHEPVTITGSLALPEEVCTKLAH